MRAWEIKGWNKGTQLRRSSWVHRDCFWQCKWCLDASVWVKQNSKQVSSMYLGELVTADDWEEWTPPKRMIKKTIEAWVNVFPTGPIFHATKEMAEYRPGPERIACVKLTGSYETEE